MATKTKTPQQPSRQTVQPVRQLTPEVVAELALEGREMRAELQRRIAKMWAIPPEQRQARSR